MDEKVLFWVSEAKDNLETALILYEKNKFIESAFFCHLAIEKMLKAFYIREKTDTPPKIHNLIVLAERSLLLKDLNESQLDFLSELNTFQLEGRYPVDRELFYRQTPKSKFKEIIKKTEVEMKWFEQTLRSKI